MTIDIPALMASIRAGEDTTLELKEVTFRGRGMLLGDDETRPVARLAEMFSSMANTEGGTVVLGVRDDGVPTGIESDKRDLVEQLVINAATENCQPMIVPRLDWEFLPREDGDSRLCLIIGIPASAYEVHQTADGRYLQRIGSHRRPIPGPQLARLLSSRRLAEPVEERPIIDAAVEDLDELRLRRHFLRRFPDWTPPDNWRETLTAHKLAVDVENRVLPTCVGILLFAEQPERFLPGAYVDLVLYRHDEADGNAADRKRFFGPVPEQIEQAVSWLRASPLNPVGSVKDGDGRHDFPAYDDRALQEAVVNALVHRDYEVRGSQVIINMFPDRIVFQNPGSLYNHLSPEMLYAGCQPVRRNQILAGFLRHYVSPVTGGAYMEAIGEGFLNLVRASERLSGRRPLLEDIGTGMRLTIYAALREHRR